MKDTYPYIRLSVKNLNQRQKNIGLPHLALSWCKTISACKFLEVGQQQKANKPASGFGKENRHALLASIPIDAANGNNAPFIAYNVIALMD